MMETNSSSGAASQPMPPPDPTHESGYSAPQRTAMLIGMFSTVRSDLSAINRALVANETQDGYLLTHEEAAAASARLLKATTTMAALGRIFAAALPEVDQLEETLNKTKALEEEASPRNILIKVENAIGGLVNRNKSPSETLKHQG